MKYLKISIVAILVLITSCQNKKESKTKDNKTTTEQNEPVTENENNEGSTEVKLLLKSNDRMQYDKKELKVKAGQKVTLTLQHTGKMLKTQMGHNFVLLKKGTDIPKFASEATEAKDNDYIPKNDAIIASTKTIGGGESVSITFDAPEKGTYDYICSFPGHYGMMKGKFIVE